MADAIKENIVRTTDGDCLRALLDIANDDAGNPVSQLKISFAIGGEKTVPRAQFAEDAELGEYLSRQGRTFRRVALLNGQGHELVSVTRKLDGTSSSLFDELSISPGSPQHQPLEPLPFARLAEVAQRRFRIAVSNDLVGLLGPEVSAHFHAREEALSRLETIIDRNFHRLDETRVELGQEHEKRQAELETAYQKRLHELESRNAEREQLLETKSQELEERKKTLDDRTNTHVRRDIRDKLLKAIVEPERFKLSEQSTTRRRWVLAGFIGLLFIFATPAALLFYKQYQEATFDPWLFGQKIGYSIAFVATAAFFLKWLNSFAATSAHEEFKLKQLQLDIDRASWLVELYFEAIATGDSTGLPSQLLDRLSHNLFENEERSNESVTAADALASALFSTAGRIRIPIPGGGELEIDKQGIRKLSKKELEE